MVRFGEITEKGSDDAFEDLSNRIFKRDRPICLSYCIIRFSRLP